MTQNPPSGHRLLDVLKYCNHALLTQPRWTSAPLRDGHYELAVNYVWLIKALALSSKIAQIIRLSEPEINTLQTTTGYNDVVNADSDDRPISYTNNSLVE